MKALRKIFPQLFSARGPFNPKGKDIFQTSGPIDYSHERAILRSCLTSYWRGEILITYALILLISAFTGLFFGIILLEHATSSVYFFLFWGLSQSGLALLALFGHALQTRAIAARFKGEGSS